MLTGFTVLLQTFTHFINLKIANSFKFKILYKNYSKKQFDAYFINILELIFEYYQYWLQWISLNFFEHDCSQTV